MNTCLHEHIQVARELVGHSRNAGHHSLEFARSEGRRENRSDAFPVVVAVHEEQGFPQTRLSHVEVIAIGEDVEVFGRDVANQIRFVDYQPVVEDQVGAEHAAVLLPVTHEEGGQLLEGALELEPLRTGDAMSGPKGESPVDSSAIEVNLWTKKLEFLTKSTQRLSL